MKVWIEKQLAGEEDKATAERILSKMGLEHEFSTDERILINPNWIIDEPSSQGNVTSTSTIEGLVKFLIESTEIQAKNIIVGDGGYSSSTPGCMRTNKVFELNEKYGIEIRNLNEEPMINKTIHDPLSLKTVKIAKIADEVDTIISVPSLKTHSMAYTTLALKNLMGVILPKGVIHRQLHRRIADLCSLFKEKLKLSLVDGIIGSDGYEIGGNPMPMGILIAGRDPVAVDTIGSAIIGYTSKQAKYLVEASKKGLGTYRFEEIGVVGPNINEICRKFKR